MRSAEAAALGEDLRLELDWLTAGMEAIPAAAAEERLWEDVCEQFEGLYWFLIEGFPSEDLAIDSDSETLSVPRPVDRNEVSPLPHGRGSVRSLRRGREEADLVVASLKRGHEGADLAAGALAEVPKSYSGSAETEPEWYENAAAPTVKREVSRYNPAVERATPQLQRADAPASQTDVAAHEGVSEPAHVVRPVRGLRDLAEYLEPRPYTEAPITPQAPSSRSAASNGIVSTRQNQQRPQRDVPSPTAQPEEHLEIAPARTAPHSAMTGEDVSSTPNRQSASSVGHSTRPVQASNPGPLEPEPSQPLDVEDILEKLTERIEQDYRRFYEG